MKKITIFFFLIFFTLSNYSQQINAIPSYWESSFWTGASWFGISEVTYTFNSNCLPIEVASKASGIDVSLSTISYDANSFPTETTTQIVDVLGGGGLTNSIKITFTYTGILITELTNYKWVAGAWELDTRTLNTYDGSNNITENLTQTWVSGAWENLLKTETTYNGNMADVVTNYSWATSLWEETSRVTNSYNGNYLDTVETSSWNGAWENSSLDKYTYDGSNFVVEILYSNWNGSSYDDDARNVITNNGDGYPTETIGQTWDGAWANESKTEVEYNECAEVPTLATDDYEEIATEVYPNPVSEKIHVNFKNSFDGKISIFDIQGRSLYTSASVNSENSIDLSQFAGGVYLLVAESENKKMVKRIVVQK